MQRVEIEYYPCKIETVIKVDGVNVYDRPDDYERFINLLEIKLPLQEWTEPVSEKWRGFVNELREDNNGFEVINISFCGRKADFESFKQGCEAENEKRKEKLEIKYCLETEALDEEGAQKIDRIMKRLRSDEFEQMVKIIQRVKNAEGGRIQLAEAYQKLKDKYKKEQDRPFLTGDLKNCFDIFAGEVEQLLAQESCLLRQKTEELWKEKENIERHRAMIGQSLVKAEIRKLYASKQEMEEQEKIAGRADIESEEILEIKRKIRAKERKLSELDKLVETYEEKRRELAKEKGRIRKKQQLLQKLKKDIEEAENPKSSKNGWMILISDRKRSPKHANSRGNNLSEKGGKHGGQKGKTRAQGTERK